MTDFAYKASLVLFLAAGPVWSQAGNDTPPPDTTSIPPATTLKPIDSTDVAPTATIDDSILMLNPSIDLDTLTEAQRMGLEFETRYRMRQQDIKPLAVRERVSFLDSLTTYYLPGRWNLREDIDRSFHHDAGDYFRFDPSYFVLEPQVTPMRKTVQPFGLAGDRTAFLVGGESLHPFEHVVEPDGLVDLNDLPTALDHTVAILPGPIGLVFGADHSVATLFTMPKVNDSTNPRSSFIVDKGAFAYSYARGRYSKDFTDGRHIDMSIGYRNAEGFQTGLDDDAYHYTGNFIFPLGKDWDIQADGQLYARTGTYQVQPLDFGADMERNRIDRSGHVRVSRYSAERESRYIFGLHYLRQGSTLNGKYDMNLAQTGHGISLAREWFTRGLALHAELTGDYLRYDSWFDKYEQHGRFSGEALLQIARLSRPWGYSAIFKQSHVQDFGFLPTAALMVRRDAEKACMTFSIGYSERAPSLNELFLPYQEANLYKVNKYADQGNESLISEKMLDGTMQVSIGRPDNSLSVSATGGKIWDGIDWVTAQDGNLTVFGPSNGDVDFASVSTIGRVRFADFARFKGGASYNYVDYQLFEKRAYTPEYQAFSGLELHLFWSQKLIDFWAYGELVYVGPYDGYVQSGLGDQVVTNVKLSFKMGNFRFHWILQNSLSSVFNPRDYWRIPGYTAYYGFTWDFKD
jgi:hypothetical protein